MKAIMILFDTLNRHMLPPYGCDWVKAPNFERLAQKSVTFTKAYVGSMPCMPARRELHTGRYNFLHRSWGPLEPFDDSGRGDDEARRYLLPPYIRPPVLWQDGGCTYHTRFTTYNHERGQEGDAWKAEVDDFKPWDKDLGHHRYKQKLEKINRKYLLQDKDMPQEKVFQNGLEFIDKNYTADGWYLQVETFDPHEPFFTHDNYKRMYPIDMDRKDDDWPNYEKVHDKDEIKHMRMQYAALVSMCDSCLGKVLDAMDRYGMWDDTMLIVTTDHGYLLGEHDYWAKNIMPWYNETANIPLFIWDPRYEKAGEENDCLVQTIDIPATLLDFFGLGLPPDMQGRPLKDTIAAGKPVRDAALFGIFGGHINCTDGRYVYMRGAATPDNGPLFQYTHMPTHLFSRFSTDEMRTVELSEPFSFTKGCKTMKIQTGDWCKYDPYPCSGSIKPDQLHENLLFDLETDPAQLDPIDDPETEKMMCGKMVALMKATDAPAEQYERVGLEKDK
jgi:arylsulfatase A-like enzyme